MNAEPIKFLLVDDTEQNLIALEALLRRDGLQILTARSGPEALELLLLHDVALAFIDVQMPAMDGFELAELMRGAERTKHVPIIFVTAGSRDPQRLFKGYESGAVDFLFKPIEPHVLKGKADVFFELYRRRRELADALRLNEMFVGILGHDLRNPLGAVLAGTQLLKAQLSDKKQLEILLRMGAAGKRMKSMIDQLLDLTQARLAGGVGFVQCLERINVANLVQRSADELQAAHPEREVIIETAGDCTTLGDADRLLQVFSNLLGNALQHGLPQVPVRITVEGGEATIVASVHNGGCIPEALLPTLFDPFRRGEHAVNRSRGLGLGLFISRQIVLAHGGSVRVESHEVKGTRFTVELPKRS